ncbi:hypothetical protein N7520_010842 [Penicillium odoratum]|uniref:uncharacterized protein n=1 Tax=Penicillium odoratum TaxID=1167516 RepID=UPI002546BFFF|nr:uncharacterized protein N7520_010842 [Penicillium odoratum]KAJ5745660.1 hypothetical protein N7520_010842 [Penicillium odoratum]
MAACFQLGDDTCVHCQIEFFGEKHVGQVLGSLSLSSGGWSSLCVPDCLPDRVVVVACLAEMAYLHDVDAPERICEDLDERMYSLFLIHAFQKPNPEIQSLMQRRRQSDTLPLDLKRLVLKRLTESGSLDYTPDVLRELQNIIADELDLVEFKTGLKNWVLRRLLYQLKV